MVYPVFTPEPCAASCSKKKVEREHGRVSSASPILKAIQKLRTWTLRHVVSARWLRNDGSLRSRLVVTRTFHVHCAGGLALLFGGTSALLWRIFSCKSKTYKESHPLRQLPAGKCTKPLIFKGFLLSEIALLLPHGRHGVVATRVTSVLAVRADRRGCHRSLQGFVPHDGAGAGASGCGRSHAGLRSLPIPVSRDRLRPP